MTDDEVTPLLRARKYALLEILDARGQGDASAEKAFVQAVADYDAALAAVPAEQRARCNRNILQRGLDALMVAGADNDT